VASASVLQRVSDGRSLVSPNTIVFSSPFHSHHTTTPGAIGYGVNENILSAYNFLVNNYTIGDELFFFGFSRGSFTCRSLAGLVGHFGILKQEEAGEWFADIWGKYQRGETLEKPDLTHNVKIKVLGCWDTVGSLGIPEGSISKFFNMNSEHAFHDTELSDSKSLHTTYSSSYSHPPVEVENAFHALALDEHRKSFSPTLWYLPRSQVDKAPDRRTRLKQCWFAGVHTDVGRGYEDHVPGDIADITFAWMVDQCRGLLAWNKNKVPQMLEKGDHKKIPEDAAPDVVQAWDDRVLKAKTWGLADLHDSFTPMFWLGGSTTRTPGQYIFKARDAAKPKTDGSSGGSGFATKSKILANIESVVKPWHWRLWNTATGVFTGPPEDLSKFEMVWTSEVIHPSVRMRRLHDPEYQPPALKDFKLTYDADRDRWSWVKRWTDDHGVPREKKLHEYRIEEPTYALSKADVEMLKAGTDEEDPLPPKPASKSWIPFLR